MTSHALITTLRYTASLIEDLLREGYSYVLTARFQTDLLKRRFLRYRQMSGGRFLIGLRELGKIADDIDACMLDPEVVQVSAVIAGYAARKVIVDRSKCLECKEMAVSTSEIEEMENENGYLVKLSRGRLLVPTTDLRHRISKSFAILDLCQHLHEILFFRKEWLSKLR